MSEKSVMFINVLSELILGIVSEQRLPDEDAVRQMAGMMDSFMGESSSPTTKSGATSSTKIAPLPAAKTTAKIVPKASATKAVAKVEEDNSCESVQYCQYILSRVRKGEACGAKVMKGKNHCSSHKPKDGSDGASKTSSKTSEPAQSTVKKLPTFGFANRNNQNFKSMAEDEEKGTEDDESETASVNKKTVTTVIKATSKPLTKTIPSYTKTLQKTKPQFFKRQFDERELLFTEDPVASQLVFEDNDGQRYCVGVMLGKYKLSKSSEPVPDDFGDNVTDQFTLTEAQQKWCTDNSIALQDEEDPEEKLEDYAYEE